ncbi:hypothetical protein [Phenylobacterium sp.]|uniref:hypothetical protein n=1 Tax=Phenylobacterium sp. TaxID=1871053 RepID=UPI002730B5F1|nr:hypothetical protein [Phenylobacterium sp.]MDP1873634.1 hypothetical protein [Phenylobacterium sp.]
MAIATSTALLATAAVSAGASIIGSRNAANASRQAGDQNAQAARDAAALQERIYNQNRQDNEPFRQIGLSAAEAIAGGMGLRSGGTPMGSNPASVSMTQPGGYDVPAYIQANQDVQQRAAELRGAGVIGPGGQWASEEEWVRQVQLPNAVAGGEQRAFPTMTGGAMTEGGAAPGYADPTAPGGYSIGARPDFGPRQDFGPAPSLDLSIATFEQDPGYELRLREGNSALNAIASTGGNRFSGNRLKAATRFNQDFASNEFDRFAGRQMGIYGMGLAQYNTDRSRADSIYGQDRARSDGLYADDRGYLTDRYDTRNQTLLSMAGFGTGATQANQSAAQSFAANQGNLMMTAANAQGQGAMGAANAWNRGIGGLVNAGAYYMGNRPSSSTPTAAQVPSMTMGRSTFNPSYTGFGPY